MSTENNKSLIILATLKELAAKLGKTTLSKRDVKQHLRGVISVSSIRYQFGTFTKAMLDAGLNTTDSRKDKTAAFPYFSDTELLGALIELEEKLGREPTMYECNSYGRYSDRPYKRFGKWPDVLARMREFKNHTGIQTYIPPPVPTPVPPPKFAVRTAPPPRKIRAPRPPLPVPEEAFDFRGLRQEPVNKQGVVFLFALIATELGFDVEAIRSGFPDCLAKREGKTGEWKPVRVEFEFESMDYRNYAHPLDGCDVVVCWRHNWRECPIEVLQLKKLIARLPKELVELGPQITRDADDTLTAVAENSAGQGVSQ